MHLQPGGATALLEQAEQQEEPGDGQAVAQHLDHRAMQASGLQAEHAEHDVTHVAQRCVRDQHLVMPLAQREHGAVHDADRRQHHHDRGGVLGDVGAERHGEPDEAVGAHLGQHARHQRRAGRRGLAVGQRQPGVEREQRALDRAGHGHGDEHEQLLARASACSALQRRVIERPLRPSVLRSPPRARSRPRAAARCRPSCRGRTSSPPVAAARRRTRGSAAPSGSGPLPTARRTRAGPAPGRCRAGPPGAPAAGRGTAGCALLRSARRRPAPPETAAR